jgi:hypothetical protein
MAMEMSSLVRRLLGCGGFCQPHCACMMQRPERLLMLLEVANAPPYFAVLPGFSTVLVFAFDPWHSLVKLLLHSACSPLSLGDNIYTSICNVTVVELSVPPYMVQRLLTNRSINCFQPGSRILSFGAILYPYHSWAPSLGWADFRTRN